MNTPTPGEAIDSELVAEVVRVMVKERAGAALATATVITRDKNRAFGNATSIANAAQWMYDRVQTARSGTPRPYSHADASHRALERMVAA